MALPDPLQVTTGAPNPLGPTLDDNGLNLAVHAPDAERIELCLFGSAEDMRETVRVDLPGRTGPVFHGHVAGLRAGQVYGLRAHGPWDPERGLRFNPAKLLVDPRARALAGALQWHDALYGHKLLPPDLDPPEPDQADSAQYLPRCLVVDPAFDWQGDRPPRTPLVDSVIYECHVGGISARHPRVPVELRGTYLGLASEPIIEHLLSLGVTAVELLPVHASVSERRLHELGLSNAWGYNTLGFFAPDARFARDKSGLSGGQVQEFRQMVRQLHAAGIEVLLDVVYNHSAEGDHGGPTLCFRGLDATGYYHTMPDDAWRLFDHSGCGNSLDLCHEPGRQLMLDSLRFWVDEMHVDGFRFDLAPALGRDGPGHGFDPAWLKALADEPGLEHVKLIAEPWDVGPHGYQLGAFPARFSEWNARFRDDVRSFWRGDDHSLGAMASRLSGSTEIFGGAPLRSINLVSCHDGFTLADLVSHEQRRNEANGEDNQDGHDHNLSCNWGVEGASDDATVLDLRERVARSLMATLQLSLGVPMLSMGDELLRTQGGNNNAYCQDNELLHVPWDSGPRNQAMLAFAQRLARLRASLPVLRRPTPLNGVDAPDGPDVTWIDATGQALDGHGWHQGRRRVLGMLLRDDRGGGPLLLLLNGGATSRTVTLPAGAPWRVLLDTAEPQTDGYDLPAESPSLRLADRALMLLRGHTGASP